VLEIPQQNDAPAGRKFICFEIEDCTYCSDKNKNGWSAVMESASESEKYLATKVLGKQKYLARYCVMPVLPPAGWKSDGIRSSSESIHPIRIYPSKPLANDRRSA
jgi:hypothetical protein